MGWWGYAKREELLVVLSLMAGRISLRLLVVFQRDGVVDATSSTVCIALQQQKPNETTKYDGESPP